MKASGEAGALHQDSNLRLLLVGFSPSFIAFLKFLIPRPDLYRDQRSYRYQKSTPRRNQFQEFWKTKFYPTWKTSGGRLIRADLESVGRCCLDSRPEASRVKELPAFSKVPLSTQRRVRPVSYRTRLFLLSSAHAYQPVPGRRGSAIGCAWHCPHDRKGPRCGAQPEPGKDRTPVTAIHLDRDGEKWASKTLRKMSIDEKVGQLIMPGPASSS